MRQALAVVVVGALVALAAGCGGGGSGSRLSKQEFITKADAICKDANDAFDQIDFGDVDPTSAAATEEDLDRFGDALEEGIGIFRDEVSTLRDLNPREDFEAAFDGAMDDLEAGIERLDEAANAAHDGDNATVRSKLNESQTFTDRADKVARDYGLEVCGAD